MATLEWLIRKVQMRLRDWEQEKISPEEIKILLNEGLDKFTRDTSYLRTTIVQDITASGNPYSLTLPGYRLGRIISLKLYDGSRDNYPILPISAEKMDKQYDYDWRNVSASKPWHYIRNFNPSIPLGTAKDTVWLYPTPDTAYTSGLRAVVILSTDNFLQGDSDELPIAERVAEEAVTNYAISETFARLALEIPERAEQYIAEHVRYGNRFMEDLLNFSVEAATGYDRIPPEPRIFYK